MLMSDLFQLEIEFFLFVNQEINIHSVRCEDRIAFQRFRNYHCIRCRYLMMEAAIVAETYEIYCISHWGFSERTSLF